MVPVLVGVAGLALGVAAGFWIRKTMAASNAQSVEARTQKMLLEAEREADAASKRALQEAKDEIAGMRRDLDEDVRTRREEIGRLERRMTDAETDLKRKTDEGRGRCAPSWTSVRSKLTYVRAQLEKATELHRAQLERIAGMTSAEARDHLMAQVIDDAKRAAMSQVREIEQRAREEGEERARKIVTIAIQRVASEQTAESTVSVFALPSEDMKGRIIGREGRNIRAFEATTGVNLIIDDTPGGGGALVLRPGAARGGADDAREARRRRPDPPGADRGGARALPAGDRRADPSRGRGRGRRGRHHGHPSGDDQAPGTAAVPHVLRSERAEAPGGVRVHRERSGRRDRGRPHHREAGRVPARHRQGGDARGRGVPRHHRCRDRAPDEGGSRGRPLHRVAPRRGRAALGPRGAGPDRRRDERRAPRRPPRVARDLREAPRAARGDLHAHIRASPRPSRCRRAGRCA